jgi:hypothetical protein
MLTIMGAIATRGLVRSSELAEVRAFEAAG